MLLKGRVIEGRRPLVKLVGAMVFALIATALFSCGKSGNPTSSTGNGPDPNGTLLSGDPGAGAFGAITTLPPIPADDADILDDGLMVTRLEAVIASTATVGLVDSVLTANDMTISCMLGNSAMVTLKTPRVADRSSVDSLITILNGSGAFSLVFRSYVLTPDTSSTTGKTRSSESLDTPGEPAVFEIEHLKAMKMPAAWNVKEMIPSASKVTVIVPDQYKQVTPHPEIPEQRFISAGSVSNARVAQEWVGNHGFHVCGIIGAKFDSTKATGTHPSGDQHLVIESMPVGGYNWNDALTNMAIEIGKRLPATGEYVLNTSLGYNDSGFVRYSKLHRALLMIGWRAWMATQQSRFLHATAAGNDGIATDDSRLASYNSPFCSAARFGNPFDMLSGVAISAADSTGLANFVQQILSVIPQAASPLQNTIIVGSNDGLGNEVASSGKNPDVRCIGDLVFSTCVDVDPGYVRNVGFYCDGSDGWYSGTSMATPQVAGLASYLWGLDPNLTVSELRDIILRSDLNNQIDGYSAVLAIDQSLSHAPVRKRLLDIADNNDDEGPDGQFDEHDLMMFMDKFHSFEDARGTATTTPDYSRFDLNGDGITGDSTIRGGRFDLDVNNPQAFGTASEQICGADSSFDETDLSDYDILRYYAYSQLYTGDPDVRDNMLGCGGGRVAFQARSLYYHYQQRITETNSGSPGGPTIDCQVVDDEDVEEYDTTGTAGKIYASSTGPCTTDGGASCSTLLDVQHSSTLSRGPDGSSGTVIFTSQIDNSAERTDVRDDQEGTA